MRTALVLFSGCGGASYGLKRAGLNVVGAVDWNPEALSYHQANFPNAQHVEEDVTRMFWPKLPRHDVLWASPSCIGHSRARGSEKRHHEAARLERVWVHIRQIMKRPAASGYAHAPKRLKHWFREREFNQLAQLKAAILSQAEDVRARRFFLFSNILKPVSVWAQSSVKPQVDPNKEPAEVRAAFERQCAKMLAACSEWQAPPLSRQNIVTGDFLQVQPPPVDLIVTSPPYVTSYEYADLHQLSALWLGFTEDHRTLRQGCLGSAKHRFRFGQDGPLLNETALKMVYSLLDHAPAKARSVAQYLLSMQRVAQKTLAMLTPGGMAFFVIGNTAYKNTTIDNAGHLVESMFRAGFAEITAAKRAIQGKTLPPNRDARGRFTKNPNASPIYKNEYILIGRKAA